MRKMRTQRRPIGTAFFFAITGIIFVILGFVIDVNILIWFGVVFTVLGTTAVVFMLLFKKEGT